MGEVISLFLTPQSLETKIGFCFRSATRHGGGNKYYTFTVEMVDERPQQILLILTSNSYGSGSLIETLAVYDSSSINIPSRVIVSKGGSLEISLERMNDGLIIEPPHIPEAAAEEVFNRAITEYLEFKEQNRIDEALAYRSSIRLLNRE